MTLGTGNVQCRAFTLIEILVVISVMVVLMAAFVANTISVGERAYRSSTKALFQRLDLALESYKDRVGYFPPDGFDGNQSVRPREGTDFPLRSSMCLYEFLGRPLVVVKPGPGGRVVVERYSSPLIRFKEKELIRDQDNPNVAEIADAWGTPIHYDRLEGENSYSIQDSPEIHLIPPEDHPPDPREVEATAMVLGKGQNPGKYDIWSHGPKGHEVTYVSGEMQAPTDIICNWRLPEKSGRE